MGNKRTNPLAWIPFVYIAEGLPYFAVNTLTVMMYTRMGIDLKNMAFFTGWLYLPWVIKPFWSPFVDIIRTKRWWTLTMQFLIAAMMASVAFFLNLSGFFALTLAAFWLMAFFSATHDIAADGYYMLELSHHEQAAYVGVRSTFYRIASILGQGGLVMLAGWLETTSDSIPTAWSLTFAVMSAVFLIISVYDYYVMPCPKTDIPHKEEKAEEIIRNFGATFATFFKKKYIITALLFMLFYRLPEAFMLKLVQPFLVTSREMGGMGLTTAEVGFVNGTVGVIGILIGGIIGGICVAKGGLKKWIWPMALSLTLPCAIYCYFAMLQPQNFVIINLGVFVEQFGYGFGFTAFMLYLIYFADGEYKTSHYSFCTAFMALGMMLPGMAAGWIFEQLETLKLFNCIETQGYVNFFWFVMLCCLPTYAVCFLLKIDSDFGKK